MVTRSRSDDADNAPTEYLTPQQAAALLQIPCHTIYQWSSQELLKECAFRVGKHLRIDRQKFLEAARSGSLRRIKKGARRGGKQY